MFPLPTDICQHVIASYIDFETLYLGRDTDEFAQEYQRRVNQQDINAVMVAIKYDDLDLLQRSNHQEIVDANLVNLSRNSPNIQQWLLQTPKYQEAKENIERLKESMRSFFGSWKLETTYMFGDMYQVLIAGYLDYSLEIASTNNLLHEFINQNLDNIKSKRSKGMVFDSLEEYQQMFLSSQ